MHAQVSNDRPSDAGSSRKARFIRGKVGLLSCLGLVVLLWVGCAGATVGKRDEHRIECPKDADCPPSLLWDRGSCVEWAGGKTSYGWACTSSPSAGTPGAGKPDLQCGGYLCLNGLCRSCQSNADCKAYFGAGQCSIVTGQNTLPGAVCWPMAAVVAEYASERTDPRDICVADPADAPGEKRLPRGLACARDCDCISSFCDHGICADSPIPGAGNYGRGPCKPGTPPGLAPGMSTILPEFCGGYVCVDQRCRSCQSDAECQERSSECRCLSVHGLPGKQCGDPNEHLRDAGAPRPRCKNEEEPHEVVVSIAPRIDLPSRPPPGDSNPKPPSGASRPPPPMSSPPALPSNCSSSPPKP
jgi:hypothetical protein